MSADSELQLEPPAADLTGEQSTVMNGTDYYTNLLQFALSQGGRVSNYRIPVHWLKMTLAGLQGRIVSVEEMWEGALGTEFATPQGFSADYPFPNAGRPTSP